MARPQDNTTEVHTNTVTHKWTGTPKESTMSKNTSAAKSFLDELAEQVGGKTQQRYEEQKANGVVNPIVLATLLDVRPQMIYNYLRKGKFTDVADAVGENNTQKKVIAIDEANTFAQGYKERKVVRETKKAEKLQAELAGETVDA